MWSSLHEFKVNAIFVYQSYSVNKGDNSRSSPRKKYSKNKDKSTKKVLQNRTYKNKIIIVPTIKQYITK